ncbi:EF hand [Nitrosospira sp. Nl5]|uniref:hypothetical protein n=1 Tax=Nitrosospira sp. Nl5 TaxID=200120 RepID=UPI000887D456|nr:hypothetical protein [Nitrosospira sp. Nl5]SCY69760.1 EF hand [Nitrosospira sp. Nl5]
MNNMPSKKSMISLAIGSAFAATLGTAPIASANESPFTTQSLGKGYMVAGHHDHGDKYGDKKDAYGEKGQDKKYGEGRCGMSMADTDNDGRVSKEEHARHGQIMFEKMDANGDGYIDKDEANKMRKKHGYGHGQKRSSYGSDDRNLRDEEGLTVKREREYGAGEEVDRDFPHMRPMGQ